MLVLPGQATSTCCCVQTLILELLCADSERGAAANATQRATDGPEHLARVLRLIVLCVRASFAHSAALLALLAFSRLSCTPHGSALEAVQHIWSASRLQRCCMAASTRCHAAASAAADSIPGFKAVHYSWAEPLISLTWCWCAIVIAHYSAFKEQESACQQPGCSMHAAAMVCEIALEPSAYLAAPCHLASLYIQRLLAL